MENVKIEADSASHIIKISKLPQKAKILAIDHDLQYENLDESFFNSFSADDYTQINKNAKKMLAQKVAESDLLQKAEQQGNQMLDVIRFLVESAGWELIIDDFTLIPEIDIPSLPDGSGNFN